MKKLVRKCVILCFPILVLNATYYFVAEKVYFKPYSHYSKNERAYLLGDSHTEALLDLPSDYGIYNFSFASDTYVDMYRKISFLLAHNHDIETIYIIADNHTLSKYRDTMNNEDRSIMFSVLEKHDYFSYITERYIKYYFVIMSPKVRSVVNLTVIAYIRKFFTIDKFTEKPAWSDFNSDIRFKEAEERMKGQFPSQKSSEKQEQALLNIIKVCREHNIKLVGVKFPLAAEYISLLNGKNYGADKILESHNIKVLDFQNLFINHSEYFLNQDHINEQGAKEFVRIFARSID